MPHIVLTNVSDFESIFNNFKKDVSIIKNEKDQTNTIIRFEEIFLNQLKNIILIKTIVIENTNQSQTYYIMAMKKNNQITIRLDPLTDPKNKTDAVKNRFCEKNITSRLQPLDVSLNKSFKAKVIFVII